MAQRRSHKRTQAQDERDLTYWKVEDRDVSHEILRHSAIGTSQSVKGTGQRIARQSTPGDCWSSEGYAQCWLRMRAGKPIASLMRLPRSKRVFRRSMIRNRARGSSGHFYGSPTLCFVWRSFKWSKKSGLPPRIARRLRLSGESPGSRVGEARFCDVIDLALECH
jgi:hypothetical protein